MAADTPLSDTLSTFTTATESAIQSLPELDSLLPPKNGISLFDTKNEIFLSYFQALALRNLNVIRSLKDGGDFEKTKKLSDDITWKLVENRVYLERGARPLEQKIKYQVDRVVRAAEDEKRAASQQSERTKAVNGHANGEDDDTSELDDEDGRDVEENDAGVNTTSYQPKLAGLARSNGRKAADEKRLQSKADGIYRPPRISATSMPTTEQRERKERKQPRSATLDEYVSTELSNTPMAEPSIGSTIAAGGRRNNDSRQLAKEQERRDYEETNLLRLPKESKKERAKQTARDRSGGFGGEEWRGLGESVDRIGDLTRRKSKESALDKSRKRRAVEDGPRSDGIGNAFDIKKRRVMKNMRR